MSLIRAAAKLAFVVITITAFLPVQPSSAGGIAYVSATGSGTACTATAPCAQIDIAFSALPPGGGRILCLTPTVENGGLTFLGSETDVVDCPSSSWLGGIVLYGEGTEVFKFQHIDFSGLNGLAQLIRAFNQVTGTVIFEDCVIEDFTGNAIDIEPAGPFHFVMKNTRISNVGSVAILLKPAAGGSINATFDHVTVTGNGGGGIRLDSTNGPVTADVTDSVITNNTGNGLSAQGGAGGAAMLSIRNSVIAKNGAAGVNATGSTGAALVQTTLLDSNTSATSVTSGGRILTYGNNSIVGPAGSGFTGPATLQ